MPPMACSILTVHRFRLPGSGGLYLDQVGIFPGSLGNYGGVHKGVPVVTIELPNATRTPLDAETRQMWLDLLRWISERINPGEPQRVPRLPSVVAPDL